MKLIFNNMLWLKLWDTKFRSKRARRKKNKMKSQGYNLGSGRFTVTNKTERETSGELTVTPICFSHTFHYATG